jgi:POT family proton-dependent oligopeptide transporter
MQSLLVLYMTHQLLLPDHVGNALGFDALRAAIEGVTGPLSTAALASQVFGLYAGFVFLTPLLGGIVADRWLGRTATVTIGAILMVCGHFLMAFEAGFLPALVLAARRGSVRSRATSRRRWASCTRVRTSAARRVSDLPDRDQLRGDRLAAGVRHARREGRLALRLRCRGRGDAAGARRVSQGAALAAGARDARRAGARTSEPMTGAEWKTLLLLVALLPVLAGGAARQPADVQRVRGLGRGDFRSPLPRLRDARDLACSRSTPSSPPAAPCSRSRSGAPGAGGGREPDEIVKVAIGAFVMALAPLLLVLASLQHQASGARISIGWGIAFQVVNEIGFAMFLPVGWRSIRAPRRAR